MDAQLNQYREEQRRKFEATTVDSQGSFTATEDQTTQPAPSAPPTPSAPPEPVSLQKNEEVEKKKSAAEKQKREAEKRKRESAEKKRQQQLDEEFARRLQDQEDEQMPQAAEEPVNYPPLPESDTSDDEQLARLLQEEEAQGSTQAPPTVQAPPEQQQPQQEQSTGFFATIGRGLRQAYDMYQQYSQQVADQQQIAQDEALARQLQSQEGGIQQPMFRVQSPNVGRRANYPNFYNYDEDVDDEDLFAHHHPSEYENPLGRLREVNSVFRSMGTPVEHPLIQHLHELMNQSQLHGSGPGPRIIFTTQGMPIHRYRYPRPVFQHVRGVENLPPELYQMVQGETDTSYESLLQLAERLQPVSRGASTSQIEELPTRIFTEGSMPASEASCGVCLSDYEKGEELRTLPGCLHSFHKECIDKWLQINKVCPICRHEITNNAEPEPQQQQQQSTPTTQRHSQS